MTTPVLDQRLLQLARQAGAVFVAPPKTAAAAVSALSQVAAQPDKPAYEAIAAAWPRLKVGYIPPAAFEQAAAAQPGPPVDSPETAGMLPGMPPGMPPGMSPEMAAAMAGGGAPPPSPPPPPLPPQPAPSEALLPPDAQMQTAMGMAAESPRLSTGKITVDQRLAQIERALFGMQAMQLSLLNHLQVPVPVSAITGPSPQPAMPAQPTGGAGSPTPSPPGGLNTMPAIKSAAAASSECFGFPVQDSGSLTSLYDT